MSSRTQTNNRGVGLGPVGNPLNSLADFTEDGDDEHSPSEMSESDDFHSAASSESDASVPTVPMPLAGPVFGRNTPINVPTMAMAPPSQDSLFQSVTQRSSFWCITDHTQGVDNWVRWSELISSDRVDRGIVSVEHAGDPEGPTHIQGYIVTHTRMRFDTVKRFFQNRLGHNTVHIEARRGSDEAAWLYCMKENPADDRTFCKGNFIENVQGKRTDLDQCAALIQTGVSMQTVASKFPCQYIRYSRGLQALQSVLLEPRSWLTKCIWLWGKTGTGKSLTAQLLAGTRSCFFKSDMTWWWCGYSGQEVVIWNDFRLASSAQPRSISWFLNLVDRYPHKVQVKGGNVEFVGKLIIVTAPCGVEDTFGDLTDRCEGNALAQVRRRVTEFECGQPQLETALAWHSSGQKPSAAAIYDN